MLVARIHDITAERVGEGVEVRRGGGDVHCHGGVHVGIGSLRVCGS